MIRFDKIKINILSKIKKLLINNDLLFMKKILFLLLVVSMSFLTISCNKDNRSAWDSQVPTVSKDISSPTFWNGSSKVKLDIYADFECPACIKFEKLIWEELFDKYAKTNKISITYKNFPLPIHKNAFRDAMASMCAHAEWKYIEFWKEMYALEDTKGWLAVTDIERAELASKVWINKDNFNKCMTEWHYINKIKSDIETWKKLSLLWTPSVYANWSLLQFGTKDDFFKIIDSLLK
jgi:protein-disulfide isomerase